MELNWSTFLLEIINFLVLVWILKRFLYRPVLGILKRRQEDIEQKLDQASRLNGEGNELKHQYQGRLESWEREKLQALDKLQQQIHAERSRKLEKLEQDLANEREKAAVVDQRHLAERKKQYMREAHVRGARFASRLLTTAAGPEVESRLFELFMESLENLQRPGETTVPDNFELSSIDHISMASAYALSDDQKQRLENVLSRLCGRRASPDYIQDGDLIAGFRLTLGAWILHLNIQDELKDFAELSNDSPLG